jgi:inner membrane protease ATP23
VVFMIKQLGFVSGGITPAHVLCAPCHQKLAGGFSPQHGILLCQDGFMNKKHMEDTLVHELVHMYDHAKFNVDWHNIRHHACSEVHPFFGVERLSNLTSAMSTTNDRSGLRA